MSRLRKMLAAERHIEKAIDLLYTADFTSLNNPNSGLGLTLLKASGHAVAAQDTILDAVNIVRDIDRETSVPKPSDAQDRVVNIVFGIFAFILLVAVGVIFVAGVLP